MHTSFLKISLTLAVSIMTFSTLSFAYTEDPIACTMEYAPVCGEVQVQCVDEPCLPVRQTFGNMCVANAANAQNITEGECKSEDYDPDLVDIADIISRAHTSDITKYDNEKDFMGTSYLTREQAAKMLMSAIANLGAEEWMVKQSAGSCKWLDASSINPDLLETATQSCIKGLFKGADGYFMPQKFISHAEMTILFERLATFIPSLKDILPSLIATHTDTFFMRSKFVRMLYTMTQSFHATKYSTYQEELNNARTLWAEQGPETYSMTQKMTCFCVPDYTRPIQYNIVNNILETGSILYADDNTSLPSDMMIDLHTVVGAFDLIQSAIDEHAASITVDYDETTGYPKSIAIDYNKDMADEEKYYSFTIATGS